MDRLKFEHVTLQLKTLEGCALAVGGICLPGTKEHWAQKLKQLQSLQFDGCDIYKTDVVIAEAIKTLSDQTLLVAGCTIDIGMELPDGVSTGGVLGSPLEGISSASEEAEFMPGGFSLYTVPGGPGIAAQASPEAVRRMGISLQKLEKRVPEKVLMQLLQDSGFEAGIVVYDGTGPGVCGRLICWSTFGWSNIGIHTAERNGAM